MSTAWTLKARVVNTGTRAMVMNMERSKVEKIITGLV
jgi:hypothetical protein